MARVVRAILGALGITSATYGALAYSDVFQAEKEAVAKRARADAHLQAKRSIQEDISNSESSAEALTKHCSSIQQRLQDTDAELEAAKATVKKLEGVREQSSQEQRTKQSELHALLGNIAVLQKDYFKRHEAYLEADKEARIAKQQAAELAQKRNPLNNPKVKELLGRR